MLRIMRRLSIEVTPEQHQQIKAMAAMKGQSIREFVINRVLPENSDEHAWSDLKSFINGRIKEAKETKPITSSFMDVFEQRIEEMNAQ